VRLVQALEREIRGGEARRRAVIGGKVGLARLQHRDRLLALAEGRVGEQPVRVEDGARFLGGCERRLLFEEARPGARSDLRAHRVLEFVLGGGVLQIVWESS